jgi:hypothetical protein
LPLPEASRSTKNKLTQKFLVNLYNSFPLKWNGIDWLSFFLSFSVELTVCCLYNNKQVLVSSRRRRSTFLQFFSFPHFYRFLPLSGGLHFLPTHFSTVFAAQRFLSPAFVQFFPPKQDPPPFLFKKKQQEQAIAL